MKPVELDGYRRTVNGVRGRTGPPTRSSRRAPCSIRSRAMRVDVRRAEYEDTGRFDEEVTSRSTCMRPSSTCTTTARARCRSAGPRPPPAASRRHGWRDHRETSRCRRERHRLQRSRTPNSWARKARRFAPTSRPRDLGQRSSAWATPRRRAVEGTRSPRTAARTARTGARPAARAREPHAPRSTSWRAAGRCRTSWNSPPACPARHHRAGLRRERTGKEFVVRLIHDQSPRAAAPFVSINCAALTETLLESGAVRPRAGAFTGAVRDKAGLFEVAGEGTIFLDEIGGGRPDGAGQAASRPAGARDPPRRRRAHHQGERPRGGGHQPRPSRRTSTPARSAKTSTSPWVPS